MNLKNVATDELAAELERREKNKVALRKRREKLLKEIRVIDAQLGETTEVAAGRASTGRPRKRAQNDVSLGDALAQAMEIRAVVSPTEAAELVKRNGYKTTSKNFNMMVSNTLAKDARFKRLSRGQYERVA